MKEKLLKLKELIKEHKKVSIAIICVFIIFCGISIKNIYHEKQIEQYNKRMAEYSKQIQLDSKLEKAKSDWEDVDKQIDDFELRSRLIILETKEVNYYGGYHDVEITIKNVSNKNVSYTKIGLNFLDENEKTIQSDTVIDSNIIKPQAQQTITKKVSDKIKYKTIFPEIQEVK